QVEEELQVGQLLLRKGRRHLRQIDPADVAAAPIEQLAKAGNGLDAVRPVQGVEVLQDVLPFRLRQVLGAAKRQLPGNVGGAADVGLELLHQRRHNVEYRLDLAEGLEDKRHVEVGPNGVQPDPRQDVAFAIRIAVARLVQVPEEGEMD